MQSSEDDIAPTAQLHFDVSHAPAHLLVEDGLDQNITFTAALSQAAAVENQTDRFHLQRKEGLTLDSFASLYDRQDEHAALNLLLRRKEIRLEGSRYLAHHNDDDLAWQVESHYLDLQICVGSGLGLAAMLPNVAMHHSVEFRLMLRQRCRRFSAKYAKLGFDPTNCMVWIGQSSSGEDSWLAWVRSDCMGLVADDMPPASGKEDTIMSLEHHRMVVMFLSDMLRRIGHRDIIVTDTYPDIEDSTAFSFATNANDQDRQININLAKMKALDVAIQRYYHEWVHNTPCQYIADDFFQSRVPVAITSRFGQNQQLADNVNDREEEKLNWKRDRDYSRLRYVTFALATHVRVRKARKWRRVNLAEVRGTYGDVYTSFDKDSRQMIDWEDLDNDNVPMYTEEGFLIPSRLPSFSPRTPAHGVLMDLRFVKELFDAPLNHPDLRHKEDDAPIDVYTYPQAGLKIAGHFQANSLMKSFLPFLSEVNNDLNTTHVQDDSPPPYRKIVHGIACQGYNAVMHSTRGNSAQHHDAQMGMLTGALSGSWAKGHSPKTIARWLKHRCLHQLPHDSFAEKTKNEHILRDLRLENVFYLDVEAMHQEDQSGQVLLEKIIHPLTYAWNHPSLMDEIKTRVVLLSPKAFPALYNWTTYPLTTLLRKVWEAGLANMQKGMHPDPTIVKLCSCLKRALNFMHTGNVAVIATSAMNPLWIGLSLINDGHPCVNSEIVAAIDTICTVHANQWPLNHNGQPASASRGSQLQTYGQGHFNVFFAHLAMKTLSTHGLPSSLHKENDQLSAASSVAYHALTIFLQDCKDLLTAHVNSSINSQIKSDEHLVSSHGRARNQALQAWIVSDHPLSYTSAFLLLIIILNSNPHSHPVELQTAQESYSYKDIAKRFLQMSRQNKSAAPVSQHGSFFHALPLAIGLIKTLLPPTQDQVDEDTFIIGVFAKMLKKMNIYFVPWHCVSPNNRAYAVRPDWFMMLKAIPLAELNDHLPQEPQEATAELAAHIMSANRDAPWSLPVRFKDMGPLWDKYLLPTDWCQTAASLPPSNSKNIYVRATYEHVQNHYNGRIWWHHLALVWGIMFSKVTPFVFASRDTNINTASLNNAIRTLPWEKGKSKNHGGCSIPLPFITMVSTTIFALLDSSSPLSIRAAATKNSLGDPWTTKHGNKEITAINLIRIGVATALQPSVLSVAKYKKNWRMKTLAELKPLYDLVMGFLKNTEFGYFLAIKEVFGEQVAIRLALNREMNVPAFVTNDQRASIHGSS